MPRKRKDAGDSGAPSPKKAKSPLLIDDYFIQWEWEGDMGKWTAYDGDYVEEICQAHSSGKKEITFSVPGGVQMKVIFDKMVQKNKKTGWERRVRCCLREGGTEDLDEYYLWQWEDEHKRWNPYDVKATFALEKACACGDSTVSLVAYQRAYTIDVTKMEQTNDTTGVVRKVQRLKTDTPAGAPSTNKTAATKATKSASAENVEEPEVAPAKGKGKSSAKGSTGKKGKSAGSGVTTPEDEDHTVVKKVLMKGKAPVDPDCTAKVNSAHVYSSGSNIFDAMLNQTNLSNNNNKYYLMQVLEDDNRKAYSVWFRWGRVGFKGQTNLIPCGPDVDEAIKIFSRKFSDKTKNDWSSGRKKFTKIPGKYDLVEVDYSAGDESAKKETKKPEKPVKVPDSKLDAKLQALINLICDVKSMEEAVLEMKYDAKKAPLGKLTATQIKAGYAALKKIDDCIVKNDMGKNLISACDAFYTRIPHNFGMRQPPVIRTKAEVKLKLQLLETLGDIEIAMKLIKETKVNENPVDTHYHALKCELDSLDHSSPDFQMIDDYVQHTHASTHNTYKMKLMDVFEVEKEGEEASFNDVGNRMLLWHGSRLTNWVGILGKGLKIAPPEAPVTGYMFGKGVYFADMSSKSANYCYPSPGKDVGLLLLCEVALGKSNELLNADYNADQLPKGTQSVTGLGRIAPDPAKNFTMADGTVVPLGKSKDTGVTNPSGYTLNYNEFIVYNLNQIRMRYMCKVKFNFG